MYFISTLVSTYFGIETGTDQDFCHVRMRTIVMMKLW